MIKKHRPGCENWKNAKKSLNKKKKKNKKKKIKYNYLEKLQKHASGLEILIRM